MLTLATEMAIQAVEAALEAAVKDAVSEDRAVKRPGLVPDT